MFPGVVAIDGLVQRLQGALGELGVDMSAVQMFEELLRSKNESAGASQGSETGGTGTVVAHENGGAADSLADTRTVADGPPSQLRNPRENEAAAIARTERLLEWIVKEPSNARAVVCTHPAFLASLSVATKWNPQSYNRHPTPKRGLFSIDLVSPAVMCKFGIDPVDMTLLHLSGCLAAPLLRLLDLYVLVAFENRAMATVPFPAALEGVSWTSYTQPRAAHDDATPCRPGDIITYYIRDLAVSPFWQGGAAPDADEDDGVAGDFGTRTGRGGNFGAEDNVRIPAPPGIPRAAFAAMLADRCGIKPEYTERYTLSLDLDRDGFLSPTEFLEGVIALDPETAHDRHWLDRRCLYIFRVYDTLGNNAITEQEGVHMIRHILRAQNKPEADDPDATRRSAAEIFSRPMNTKQFAQLVSDHKIRGTSKLLRMARSLISAQRAGQSFARGVALAPPTLATRSAATLAAARGGGAASGRPAGGNEGGDRDRSPGRRRPGSDGSDNEHVYARNQQQQRQQLQQQQQQQQQQGLQQASALVRRRDEDVDESGRPRLKVHPRAVVVGNDGSYIGSAPSKADAFQRLEAHQMNMSLRPAFGEPGLMDPSATVILSNAYPSPMPPIPPCVDRVISTVLSGRYEVPLVGDSYSLLTEDEIRQVCTCAWEIMSREPTLVEVPLPCRVFGDIHGQLSDFLRLLQEYGLPEHRRGDIKRVSYVFDGDFVDRGEFSLEVVTLLVCLKCRYPDRVFLIRGNHEIANTNAVYGFLDQCLRRIPDEGEQKRGAHDGKRGRDDSFDEEENGFSQDGFTDDDDDDDRRDYDIDGDGDDDDDDDEDEDHEALDGDDREDAADEEDEEEEEEEVLLATGDDSDVENAAQNGFRRGGAATPDAKRHGLRSRPANAHEDDSDDSGRSSSRGDNDGDDDSDRDSFDSDGKPTERGGDGRGARRGARRGRGGRQGASGGRRAGGRGRGAMAAAKAGRVGRGGRRGRGRSRRGAAQAGRGVDLRGILPEDMQSQEKLDDEATLVIDDSMGEKLGLQDSKLTSGESSAQRAYNMWNELFAWLPLGGTVADRVLIVHGMVGNHVRRLDDIRSIERPVYGIEDPRVTELLWSDPAEVDAVKGLRSSPRGPSISVIGSDLAMQFCEENNLDLVVRAHQCVNAGYEFFAGGHVVTVFSATNYCGRHHNDGALLEIDEDMEVRAKVILSTSLDTTWSNIRNPTPPRRRRKTPGGARNGGGGTNDVDHDGGTGEHTGASQQWNG